MAYNGAFNPDALPAHAEPDQAAQMLAYQNPRPPSAPNPSPFQTPSYQNKPPPPIPQQQKQQLHQQQPQPQHQLPPQSYPTPQPYQRHSPSNSSYAYNELPAQVPPPMATSLAPRYQNYGQSPHLGAQQFGAPQAVPPARPWVTSGAVSDASLFPLFKAVDKRGTGQLSEEELRAALVNGDFTSFDSQTVKMMIRMFDADRSGTIGFEEFCGLWGFLAAWRALFDKFDEDRSGTISYDEYSKALVAFGYHLSPSFVIMMYRLYDKRNMNSMSFDIFVQSCISLKRMTDVFKKYDSDRDGFITLSFEEFLTEILQQR